MTAQDRNTDIVRLELTWDEVYDAQQSLLADREVLAAEAARLRRVVRKSWSEGVTPRYWELCRKVERIDTVLGVIQQHIDAKRKVQA